MTSLTSTTSLSTGTIWFTIASIISKFSSFVAQIILGWYLTSEQFGLYAIALSLSAWGLAFRNGGTDQVLIQQGHDFSNLYPKILSFSIYFNILACLFLTLIGWLSSRYYHAPELLLMLFIIGLAQIFTSPAVVLRAKLSVDGKYKALSYAVLVSDFSRQGTSILLAIMGAGALSFIIPIAIEPIVSALCIYALIKFRPKPSNFDYTFFKALFKKCKWLMVSNMSVALTLSGSYFVVSIFLEPSAVGLLFFAMQLIIASSAPLTNTINTVIFSHLSNNLKASSVNEFVSRGFQLTLMLGFIIACMLFVSVELIIQYFWQDKWHEAIALAKVFSFSVPSSMVSALVFSLVSAKGFWRLRFYMIFASALLDMCVAGVASNFGTLDTIVTGLVISRFIYVFFLILLLHRIFKFFDNKQLSRCLILFSLCLFSSLIALFSSEINSTLWVSSILASVSVLFTFLLFKLLKEVNRGRAECNEIS